ncbi:MAG: DUF1598 domain-containing protein [Planctomycetes bacterium]|nr:DUF1598 domain-containing protein [Planctomycetota bacterium]
MRETQTALKRLAPIVVAIFVGFALLTAESAAQRIRGPAPRGGRRPFGRPLFPRFVGGQNITVQGVYIDVNGVLYHRRAVKGSAARFRLNRAADASLVYISLPKLFAEVQRLAAAGKPIPERMRYLDGMVKLRFIFIDPEKKDLIIAGPAETWDAGNSFRPRGKRTGRPILQLDDLVVALRNLGPGGRSNAFGCTLVPAAGAAGRVAALQAKVRRVRPGSQSRIIAALKEAIGPLQAKFFGIPADTRFAFVCVEADYLMKRISLGLDRPAVSGLRSYLDRSSGGSLFNRFWFTANYPPLIVAADGLAFEIPQTGLKILASDSPTQTGTNNPAARQFAVEFTQKMAKLESAVPAFADLHNLADLAILAALIRSDRLHEKAGWNLSAAVKPSAYRVTKIPVPKQADTLVAFKKKGRRTVTVAGGVQLSVRKLISRRKKLGKGEQWSLRRHSIEKSFWSVRIKPNASSSLRSVR